MKFNKKIINDRLKKLERSFEYLGDKEIHWTDGKTNYFTVLEMDEDIARAFHKFLSEYPQYLNEELIIRAYPGSGIGTNFIVHDAKTGKAIADITDYYNW